MRASEYIVRSFGDSSAWVVEELKRRGVKRVDTSRFQTYAEKFARNAYLVCEQADMNGRGHPESLAAISDVNEMDTILQGLPDAKACDLQALVNDNPVQSPIEASPGRDRQLELFVAATLMLGGCNAKYGSAMKSVSRQQSDAWVEAGGVWVALEVKRVKSLRRLESCLLDRSGIVEQLGRSELYLGVGCIDVSVAINPSDAVLHTQRSHEEIDASLRDRLRNFVLEYNSVFRRAFTRSAKLIGILVVDQTFVYHDGTGVFEYKSNYFIDGLDRCRPKTRAMEAFKRAIVLGSRNCVNLDKLKRVPGIADIPMLMGLRPMDQVISMRHHQSDKSP